jgi:hypothetical protein
MDSAGLLRLYFGTPDICDVTPEEQLAGMERLLVEFGLEQNRGKRFALWSLLCLMPPPILMSASG